MNFKTERFIDEVKNRPCIWNSALIEYNDRNLKTQCWDELVEIFKERDDMTVQDRKLFGDALQRKWKSLRSCFSREINRQRKAGYGCGRRSEYVFFKKLQFLKNVVLTQEPDSVADVSDLMENEQKDKELVKPPKRLKTKENVTEDEKLATAMNRTVKSKDHSSYDEDEDKLFMLSMVQTLKRIPAQRKMATKIKIMTILDKATRTEAYHDIESPGPSNDLYSQSFCSVNLPLDGSPDSPMEAKPSNISNYSEESLFDLYD